MPKVYDLVSTERDGSLRARCDLCDWWAVAATSESGWLALAMHKHDEHQAGPWWEVEPVCLHVWEDGDRPGVAAVCVVPGCGAEVSW